MKKYKVCRLVDGEVISPFQKHTYGTESRLFGQPMVFYFDESDEQCSDGFYATDADGIIYSLNKHPDCRVYEVEVGGKEKIFDAYKQRYSEATFIRRLSDEDTRAIIKQQSDKMDWNYYEACFPIDPRKINVLFDREKSLSLLRAWDSVWASVRDSVGDSVWAYVSSLFPNIKKWKGINHADGVNPFQSGIDLWMMGLIPSFDGNVWRLHKGEKMDVVLEISKEDLTKMEQDTSY